MAETHHQRIHTAPVVLDIGEHTGTLVIYTRADRCGTEIEVSPRHDDIRRVHTDVAERRFNGRSMFAAVFLPFPAGDYTIWGPDPQHPTAITIVSGAVTELDWR
ncbi:MAG: hypothetical protein OJF49_004102 [Ktedonobacterales bacterium]|jgi:hypothetical protein|nr:MAG: hypothetical protein OJF49_004102 [Ktedonobacterales bacterium]